MKNILETGSYAGMNVKDVPVSQLGWMACHGENQRDKELCQKELAERGMDVIDIYDTYRTSLQQILN